MFLQQAPELLPDGNLYDGNGIGNIEWSPSGSRFLVEISQWTWGTDGDAYTKYILINAADASVRELSIPAAIRRYFAQPCARLIESKGWLDDGRRISIELMPAKAVDEDGAPDPTPSCVATPTLFSFDVDSGEFLKWAINRYITH